MSSLLQVCVRVLSSAARGGSGPVRRLLSTSAREVPVAGGPGKPSTTTAPAAAATNAAYTVSELPDAGVGAGATAPVAWGRAVVRGVRGHTKKLNPIARQVAGLAVNEALVQLAFSQQKRASAARQVLEKAARNAEFHHAVPSERLIVDRAWTGKHMSSPRLRYHSKGRAGRSHFRTSMLSVRLREMTADEALAKRRFGPAKLDPAAAAKLNPRAY